MTPVTPKIFFLGQPQMHLGSDDDPGVTQWLRHLGGQDAIDCLLHVDGTDIEKLIELLARRCYKSFAPGLNPNVKKIRQVSEEYHANIAKSRHGSVVAHGMVTYAFEDVSRVFCFHPDVELLTISGWRRAEEISLTDVLLTKNPVSGFSRWSVPKSVQKFKYDGDLLFWETSQTVSPPVTPDHLLWAAIHENSDIRHDVVNARKIPASELFGLTPLQGRGRWKSARPRQFVVDNRIKFLGDDPLMITIGGKNYDADTFLEWLGWVATDGNISEDGKRVEVSQTKTRGQARLDFLFSALFEQPWHVYGKRHKVYRISDESVTTFCRQHVGRLKTTRNFSPWLMGLSDRLLNKFYVGALGGDGVIHKNNGHVVMACATSHTAKQWQVILARLGRSSNVREDASRIGTSHVLNGVDVWCNQAENSLSIHLKGESLIKQSQQKKMAYDGFVYCPETEDGLVFARYRGQSCWIGNTHEVVRNWVGNERSQESLRYVRLTDLRFWTPPIISREKERRVLGMAFGRPGMREDTFCGTPEDIFDHVIATCEWGQRALAKYYDIENVPDFETKKKLTSAFRRIAPIGLATGIGISFNLRSLRWVIEQRTHESAEEEMRLVMGLIAEDAMRRWPMMFQDFSKVDTGDGLFKYVPKYSKI
jgi:thymidylate synthase ThyX